MRSKHISLGVICDIPIQCICIYALWHNAHIIIYKKFDLTYSNRISSYRLHIFNCDSPCRWVFLCFLTFASFVFRFIHRALAHSKNSSIVVAFPLFSLFSDGIRLNFALYVRFFHRRHCCCRSSSIVCSLVGIAVSVFSPFNSMSLNRTTDHDMCSSRCFLQSINYIHPYSISLVYFSSILYGFWLSSRDHF